MSKSYNFSSRSAGKRTICNWVTGDLSLAIMLYKLKGKQFGTLPLTKQNGS
jgi:hypothetical protein